MSQPVPHGDLLLPLTHFSPSPTNPRTRNSGGAIQGLADSIATHGLMQPILARHIEGAAVGQPLYEIVAGHRRWRACTLLAETGRNPYGSAILALVRELTDAQVLAMQLVENIQREDLHPLDEAEHYRRMRDDAHTPATVEEIAQVGKVSPTRVYERLSLLHLVPAAREAFLADKLSLKTALQVARMPPAHQAEVTTHLSDWGGEPMAPKAAAAFIRERYMLRLTEAPFDAKDAALVADAGACTACAKRTGASPQLFADITDADTCTDTTCFATKKAAQRARLVDELHVSGYTVLQGDEARAVCTADGRALKPGLHPLESQVPAALGDPALRVVDALTKAGAPNAHTKAIDHPLAPTVAYAVATPELEAALRKIKAHRVQLDKAKAKAAPPPAAAPAAAPAPAASPATTPEQALADATKGEPLDAMGFPLSSWIQKGASGTEQRPGAPSDELVAELLAFTPPPTSAGLYRGRTAAAYRRLQHARATGILTAAHASAAMLADGAEGLPQHRLAHLLLILLLWTDTYLVLPDAARLAGIKYPDGWRGSHEGAGWVWALDDAQAERMAMVLLAAQETSDDDCFARFAPTVIEALNLRGDVIHQAADASVELHFPAATADAAAKSTTKSKAKKGAAA